MPYGAIYIAHNARDGDNTFKVGKTERVVNERMRELTSSTSNLGTYTAIAYFVVYDTDAAEQACHRTLRRYRVQNNREFFQIPLPRLIRIVSEQVQPFAASNFVPTKEIEDQRPEQLSATDRLKSARAHRQNVHQLWDDELASAKTTAAQWARQVREKALHASEDLASEVTLKWHVSPSAISDLSPSHTISICSVTVGCLFSKEPLVLWHSGLRGGIYGSLDLSRALGEPEVRRRLIGDKQVEFVKWKELDDGRIGRIELLSYIDYSTPSHREGGIAPAPKMIVAATHLRYNDYEQKFETKNKREKSFCDPAEAFEVFLELIVENAEFPHANRPESEGGLMAPCSLELLIAVGSRCDF